MRLFTILLATLSLTAAEMPEGWTTWSARAETAPRTFVDKTVSRSGKGSLAIAGNSNAAAHGGWQKVIGDVKGGAWYRFVAYYRSEAVAQENWQIVARLDWRDAAGKRTGQPEYVYRAAREGSWTRVTVEAPAPAEATAVNLNLYLSNAPLGTVWWDDVSFEAMTAPAARKVKVASVNLRPANSKSAQESVGRFLDLIDKAVPADADVILLPEGITVVGTTLSYAEVAESIPGPVTQRLGEMAKKRKAYLAAGIYEKEGSTLYNTAVLFDRAGVLIGKYRKVYLPREEIERGLTPGNSYPVFQTDFGTVGMMICYDVFFADPARALALQGAEMLLMPIWGGDETLAKARAIENKVWLVASGYDHPTYIMDPDGERVAAAPERGMVAVSVVDLNKRFVDPWLGDMHGRRMKELRLDVKMPEPGLIERR
jgi:predicted amidohydrolase